MAKKLKPLLAKHGDTEYLTRVPTVTEFQLLCNKKQVINAVVAIEFADITDSTCFDFNEHVNGRLIPADDDGETCLGDPTFKLLGIVPPRGKFKGLLLVRVTADASETLEYFDRHEKKKETA